MAFGGNFGAAINLVPFGIIFNAEGEVGAGYDANDNLQFQRASGSVYTPRRVDMLLIAGVVGGSPVLGAVTLGAFAGADVDCGTLVTAAPGLNEHGLPANFGPGRGKWPSSLRLRVHQNDTAIVVADSGGQAPTNLASVQTTLGFVGPGDVSAFIRNLHIQELDTLFLRVECIHSIQG